MRVSFLPKKGAHKPQSPPSAGACCPEMRSVLVIPQPIQKHNLEVDNRPPVSRSREGTVAAVLEKLRPMHPTVQQGLFLVTGHAPQQACADLAKVILQLSKARKKSLRPQRSLGLEGAGRTQPCPFCWFTARASLPAPVVSPSCFGGGWLRPFSSVTVQTRKPKILISCRTWPRVGAGKSESPPPEAAGRTKR